MSGIKTYRGESVTVEFDPARCIHAAECVHGLPAVFDPKARPWIRPAEATAAEVRAVVTRCPTGALRLGSDAVAADEAAPAQGELRLVADGPLYLRGAIEIHEGAKAVLRETRMALCRCGASKNKPFCDNSHVAAGFKDDGVCAKVDVGPDDPAPPAGPIKLTLNQDGPVQCDGPVTLFDAFGEPVAALQQTWLCRCGGSKNKPFCDGSHKGNGFRS